MMAVTTTDDAKKLILGAEGVPCLVDLLVDSTPPQRLLRLNVLKTIANVAVNPKVRSLLRASPIALPMLCDLEEGDDVLVTKHAAVAKAAVLWEP